LPLILLPRGREEQVSLSYSIPRDLAVPRGYHAKLGHLVQTVKGVTELGRKVRELAGYVTPGKNRQITHTEYYPQSVGGFDLFKKGTEEGETLHGMSQQHLMRRCGERL